MSKRRAEKELTRDNCDQDDGPVEVVYGDLPQAAPEVLATRK